MGLGTRGRSGPPSETGTETKRQGLSKPSARVFIGFIAAAAAVPLSSVSQPRVDLGRRAAELLFGEIQATEAGEPHQHIQERFTPALVVRSSSMDERVEARV